MSTLTNLFEALSLERAILLDALKSLPDALLEQKDVVGEEALNWQYPWPEWEGTLATYMLEEIGGHEREHRKAVLAAAERR